MKRALILASVASMIDQFNMPNILLLKELGYKIDVAANFTDGCTCNDEKIIALKRTLIDLGVDFYQIDFARNVFKVGQNLKAYRQTRKLVKEHTYDLIHCHSPIGGFLLRIAAKDIRMGNRGNTKVVYTAHGFHFYKGAPLLNWLLFYPIEKLCSYWTDVLVTITYEDYKLAQEKMSAKEVVYVPGVGIDIKAFLSDASSVETRRAKRRELGVKEKDIMLLSVGELNKNKNHEIILRAMSAMGNKNIQYYIAGRGVLKEHLECLALELGLKDQFHLLGFRTDVKDLFKAADIFVHPSFREGLSVAVMEAMASALPVICTEIRGNTDLIDAGKGGFLFNPADVKSATMALSQIVEAKDIKAFGQYNAKKAEGLDVKVVLTTMRNLYS